MIETLGHNRSLKRVELYARSRAAAEKTRYHIVEWNDGSFEAWRNTEWDRVQAALGQSLLNAGQPDYAALPPEPWTRIVVIDPDGTTYRF